MDFSALTWVLIGIGSALFVILTWLPVGGLSVRLWNNVSPYRILFDIEPAISERDLMWLGYVILVIYLFAWIVLCSVYCIWIVLKIISLIVVKIVEVIMGTLKLSHKIAKKLSGW